MAPFSNPAAYEPALAPLGAARGIVLAVALSSVFWVGLAITFYVAW